MLSDPFSTTASLAKSGLGTFGEALQLTAEAQRQKQQQEREFQMKQQLAQQEFGMKGQLAEQEARYKQQYPTIADLFYKKQMDAMESGGQGARTTDDLKSEFIAQNPQYKSDDIVIKKKPTTYKGVTTLVDVPEVDQKLYEQRTTREKHTTMVKDSATEVLDAIKEAKNGIRHFGVAGWAPSIPGTDRVKWEANVDKILSGKVLEVMNNMKQASRTGATGFGQLNKSELKVLQDASTTLKRTMSPKDAQKVLDNMESKLKIISGDIAKISTDEEFDALPSGTDFIGPDGQRRKKP